MNFAFINCNTAWMPWASMYGTFSAKPFYIHVNYYRIHAVL